MSRMTALRDRLTLAILVPISYLLAALLSLIGWGMTIGVIYQTTSSLMGDSEIERLRRLACLMGGVCKSKVEIYFEVLSDEWVTFLTGGAIACLGLVFVWIASRLRQRVRDHEAARLYEAVEAAAELNEEMPRFSLYLRPFASTGRHSEPAMINTVSNPFWALTTITFELENQLRKSQRIPLIALGRPGEFVGAGRIGTTEREWKDKARILMLHSEWIFLLPSASGGTLWEIQEIIAHHLLHKTVFIRPAMRRKKDRARYALEWEALREELAGHRLTLPEFGEKGCVFHYGAERTPVFTQEFDVSKLHGIGPALSLLKEERARTRA